MKPTMNPRSSLLSILFLVFSTSATAQFATNDSTTQDLDLLIGETIDIDDIEDGSYQADYELLATLAQQKIDLNHTSRDELALLPFLSEEQIQDICEYIYFYAPLRSIGELAMIPSLDATTRQRLLQFAYIPTTEKDSKQNRIFDFHHAKSQLTLSANVPFYKRQGDRNGYVGYPLRHSLRYSLHAGKHIRAGIVAAQDPGEPFFAGTNKWGYDFTSAYVMLQKLRPLNALVVGRYRLQMAEGLIMGGTLSFGKLMSLHHLGRTNTTIIPHSSRMEAPYLQGAAANISISPHLNATAFASHRYIDATLNSDSTIATLLTTGYHRTPSEISRKHNAKETIFGASLGYNYKRFSLAANALTMSFSRPLQPDSDALFRRYHPRGKHFWNASLSYSYHGKRLSIGGETAIAPAAGNDGPDLALATLNTLSLKTKNDLSLLLLQRFYSYRYVAPHARSFGFNTNVQNESGIFVGANYKPSPSLDISAYADVAYFPWARYLADQPSHAAEALLSARYQHGNTIITARYQIRRSEKNDEDHKALVHLYQQRARLQLLFNTKPFSLKTQVQFATAQRPASLGALIAQTVAYHKSRFTINATAAYFNTHDYDSRLYLQEPHMRFAFANTMLYGHGIRYMLLADVSITKELNLRAKLSTSNYFDRSTISSGLQLIDHSSQTDLSLQLHWTF